MLISEAGMKSLKAAHARRARIRELLTKYPEPWSVEKEPHDYADGTTEFTHVRYRKKPAWAKGEEICVEIGSHVTPDLAELLILLQEHAQETIIGAAMTAQPDEHTQISRDPNPPVAESGWQEMETAKRDETAILLRFAPSSGFTGCMLCWFDKDNPKGNPWRVPLCDAWFGEDLFDAWMPAPPHIAEEREKP